MRYLLRNLGFYLLAFWASITLNFLLPRLMPGDPVSRMFARSQSRMQPEQIEQIRRLFGLDDRPMWRQYIDYIGDVCTGNMGISLSRFPTPVSEVIASQIGWTLLLGGTALVIAVVIGNLLGILAAWRRAASWTRSSRRCWSSPARSRTSGSPWARSTCSAWCSAGSRCGTPSTSG